MKINTAKIFSIMLLSAIMFISCGEQKNGQSRVPNVNEDAALFAKTVYGDNAVLTLKGDINANGKPDALALVIKKQSGDMNFWIDKGGIVEKDNDRWSVILGFDIKLLSSKGAMINQEDARFGYLLGINMSQSPVFFAVTITNQTGQPASDELIVVWDSKENVYKITSFPSDKNTP